jgi:transposase
MRISEYATLYDRLVPESHFLRRIDGLTDFGFVLDELRDKYSPDMGRTAINPIVLFKYLLLKSFYRLSDRDLVERSAYDLSFKCFLGYLPEDEVIHPSELTKFREQRLQDEELLDKLIEKSVGLAIEHGAIICEEQNLIVDSTHSLSRYHNLKPAEALREQSKQLRKAIYRVDEKKKEEMPAKPTGGGLDEEIEYTEELLGRIEPDGQLMMYADIKEKANLLREMLDDNLEHLKTSEDPDAKVGHKTEDSSFFGYKTHLGMLEEGIIAAATVTSGEKLDGKHLKGLVEKSKKAARTRGWYITSTRRNAGTARRVKGATKPARRARHIRCR